MRLAHVTLANEWEPRGGKSYYIDMVEWSPKSSIIIARDIHVTGQVTLMWLALEKICNTFFRDCLDQRLWGASQKLWCTPQRLCGYVQPLFFWGKSSEAQKFYSVLDVLKKEKEISKLNFSILLNIWFGANRRRRRKRKWVCSRNVTTIVNTIIDPHATIKPYTDVQEQKDYAFFQ